jgi:Fe-S cluster assembly iron-binding protein IscA
MLAITEEARDAIQEALSTSDVPASAGIRISTALQPVNGTGPAIAFELAAAPLLEDQVWKVDGAQIFLAPEVAGVLENKVLDADVAPGGEVRFALRDRA